MSPPRMIRCINGHVFDANTLDACPTCGWTEKTTTSNDGAILPPDPNRRLIVIASAGAVIAAAGASTYALLRRPDPPPEPVVVVPEKKPSEPQHAKTPEEKPVDPKAVGLPRFADLQPLKQDAQIAAAAALGLSSFATEMALVTRAIRLSERQPVSLTTKRMLVDFVKSGQPQALSEAGSACYFGYAVQVDDKAALDYLTRAANLGIARARAGLAQMNLAGRAGKPRDREAANELYILAARADSVASAQLLVLLKQMNLTLDGRGPTAADLTRAVAASDWELAVKLARVLADVQIAAGYNVLGERHWQGVGLEKNPAAAIDWWKKATAIGFANSSYNLSLAAQTPISGSGNSLESMVWLQIAFLQAEDKPRVLYFTDKISSRAGLLDREQWTAIKTLFADIQIPGAS